jgi:HSP20 family protein
MAEKSTKGQGKPAPARKAVPVRTAPRTGWPMSALERQLDRLFDDMRFPWPRSWPRFGWPSEWGVHAPAIDVFDKDDEVVVKAEVPGMSRDDIEVQLTESALTIKGEKKKEEEIKEQDYYQCERTFGAFVRTVQLPADIKSDEAKASFKDGLLEIRIPKAEPEQRKTIKVKVE